MKVRLKQNPGTRPVIWIQTLAVVAVMIFPSALSQAATLYVSQTSTNPTRPYATWDTAAHTIQEAVDISNDGDTVLVAAGEYRLTNQIMIAKAILLRSDLGREQTVLDAQNEYLGPKRCLRISNSGATLDGFTLRNGNGAPDGGGGVFIVGATVQNCTIQSCYSWPEGPPGGVVMVGGMLSNCIVKWTIFGVAVSCSGGGLITDCQIVDNRFAQADGGVYLTESELRNSVISWNRGFGYGGGVHAIGSRIVNCTLANNLAFTLGGGAYLNGCEMDRCIIAGNRVCMFESSGRGGGIFATNSVIRNSLIVSNLTCESSYEGPSFGGGVYLSGGSLLNCTVSGNVSGTGAGAYVENGAVRNSIVYFNSKFNSTSESNWENGGGGTFEHVCTTPDPGGVGNLALDPQFVDPANGNFRVLPSSLCIAAGAVQDWMTGAFDLDANPRTTEGFVDIGAYERQFAGPQDRANGIIGAVTFLVGQGVLTQDQGNGLTAKLRQSEHSTNAGRVSTTCNQLNAFLNQVSSLVQQGTLSQALGQALTNQANALRAVLGCQ